MQCFENPYRFVEDTIVKWSTPSYQDLRLGFEINLYINNR